MRRPCSDFLHGLDDARATGELHARDVAHPAQHLAQEKTAGGAMISPPIDIIGSCTTMTIDKPIKDIKSRPTAPMSKLMTWLTAAAPVVSREMNSEEWRSAK